MTGRPRLTAERRFHHVSNALQVVKGAVSALTLYDEDLTTSDKRQLEDAIVAAMAELEALLDLGEAVGDVPSGPAGSLGAAVDEACARGADVRLDVTGIPALCGEGDELRRLLAEFFVAVCWGTDAVTHVSTEDEHVALAVDIHRSDGAARRFALRLRRA